MKPPFGRRTLRSTELGFESLEPRAMLTTLAFISGDWDNPVIWSNGVPDSTQRAIIPQNINVTLTGIDHIAKEIVVQGTLDVAESGGATKTLTADWIHVNSGGVFQIGTEQNRYDANDFVVTLTGDNPNEVFNVEGAGTITNNNAFLMVGGGGRLQFFGDEKLTFTKLAATANVNASQILVEKELDRDFDGDIDSEDGSLNWEVGDQIVIASSTRDYRDEEVRLITAINDQGDGTMLITLNAPLQKRHYGEIESYGVQEASSGLAGDFNNDYVVDAADYTLWRQHQGAGDESALNGNGNGTGGVDEGDYALWRSNYGNSATPGTSEEARTWDLDLRAEVAILNRNVRISGVASQDTDNVFGDRARFNPGTVDGFGAHTMIMASAGQVTIDSVQFDRMGQTARLGRYPIHWHLGGDRDGDILRGASITNSNNRGVTVHGTHNLLIQDVVLHDIHGHGFFMEDGVETGNEYIANIAFGIHKVGRSAEVGDYAPDLNDPFIVDTHDHVGQNARRFLSSAAYWITNPDNTWLGNVSAGSEGTGFWFILPRRAIGESALNPIYSGVNPSRTNLRQFDYNSSHASPAGLNFDRGPDIEGPVGASLLPFFDGRPYEPPQEPQINYYTGYKHTVAVYHRGEIGNFHQNRYADSFTGTFITFTQRITDTLYVGHSRGNADLSDNVTGHTLYDGANTLTGNHFAGFAEENAHVFRTHSSARRHTHHLLSETSFEDDGSANHVSISTMDATSTHPSAFDFSPSGVYDVDGTLTGHAGGGAGSTVVTNHPFFYDSNDILPAGWNAWISDDLYAMVNIESNNSNADFRFTAPDGDTATRDGNSFNTVVKMDAGDYTISFPNGVGSVSSGFNLTHFVRVGPSGSTVFRFENAGNALRPSGVASASSLPELRNATSNRYTVVGNDLYVKLFSSSNRVPFIESQISSATLWQDDSPLSGGSAISGSLAVNTVNGSVTGDASRGQVGQVALTGSTRYGNINSGTLPIASEFRGTPYELTVDYFVPVGTTLDSLPGGGSPDLFYLQVDFNGVNTASEGFIGAGAAGDGWNTLTLQGTVPGNANNAMPYFIIADGGFGGASPNGNGSGTAVYIDDIRFTVGGASASLMAGAIASVPDANASLQTDQAPLTTIATPASGGPTFAFAAIGPTRRFSTDTALLLLDRQQSRSKPAASSDDALQAEAFAALLEEPAALADQSLAEELAQEREWPNLAPRI